MKKNGQYVGVDEKYVPQDEKYVEDNLNSEIKNDMHNVYRGAREYISNKDNQEKIKKAGKRGLKVAAGVWICQLVLVGIIIVTAMGFIIFAFSHFFK